MLHLFCKYTILVTFRKVKEKIQKISTNLHVLHTQSISIVLINCLQMKTICAYYHQCLFCNLTHNSRIQKAYKHYQKTQFCFTLSWPRIFLNTFDNIMAQDILGYFWQYHGLGYFGILLAILWPRIFLDTYGNVMAQDIFGYLWQCHGLGYFGISMVQGYKRRQSGEQPFSKPTPVD